MTELKPTVWIGKRGISDSQIQEIKDQLSRKKLIKIKLLKSALDSLDRREIANQIEKKSGGKIMNLTGLTIIVAAKGVKNGR